MRAMDVMTTAVITVSLDSTVQDLAKLMSERGISGVPVVENGRLVGIVSEGDLLHRAESGTERRTARRRWRWFDPGPEEARDYIKTHGQTIRHIMTREVISVDETTDLADVATLMETNRIKRVPVLRDGMLIGILSRANLVRAVAAIGREPATGAAGGDREIRAKLIDRTQRTGMGPGMAGRDCRAGRCRASVDLGHPPRSGTGGVARRRRERSRGSPHRRARRAGPDIPPVLGRAQPGRHHLACSRWQLSRFVNSSESRLSVVSVKLAMSEKKIVR
jgi:CBS domain-containing protein